MVIYDEDIILIKKHVECIRVRKQFCSCENIQKVLLERGPSYFCDMLQYKFPKKERKLILKYLKSSGNIYTSQQRLAKSKLFTYGLVDDVNQILTYFYPYRESFFNIIPLFGMSTLLIWIFPASSTSLNFVYFVSLIWKILIIAAILEGGKWFVRMVYLIVNYSPLKGASFQY